MKRLLAVEEALELVLARVTGQRVETIFLESSLDRVLVEDVISDADYPVVLAYLSKNFAH